MEISQKKGMKRAVIYISEHIGNWVIDDIEPIDQRVRKSRGQLTRITIKKPEENQIRKVAHTIGITSEIPDY